jgi:hypothetical protein
MDASMCMAEREQFEPVLGWVDVDYKVRTANTVIEMPRVAMAGRAQAEARHDLVRTLPPRTPVLPAKTAVAKPQAAQSKPQLPAWLSRISQRLVE